MSKVIEVISTITIKGQTTVPKVVRQMLGIGYREKKGTLPFTSPKMSPARCEAFSLARRSESLP